MRKSLLAFVVLAVLASAVPASAQAIRWGYIPQTIDGWYYMVNGDQVGMLTADNLGMVRGLTNQLRRSEYRSLRDDLRWNSGYGAYGLPIGGGFYPMYDRQMRPMGRREATITGAAIGAAIGYGVSGNGRGTAIGGAAGAIIGLLTRRGKNQNQRDDVIVTPPPSGRGSVRQGVGGGPIGSYPTSNSSSTGEWRVTNRTSKRAELYDGDELIARLQPGQSIQVPMPATGYSAVLLIPNRSGGIDKDETQIRDNSNFNGWDIVAPAVQ